MNSSSNPLEQPWTLTPEEFTRRTQRGRGSRGTGVPPVSVHGQDVHATFHAARDETVGLMEEIAKVEREIDERVAGLYGVSNEKCELVTNVR